MTAVWTTTRTTSSSTRSPRDPATSPPAGRTAGPRPAPPARSTAATTSPGPATARSKPTDFYLSQAGLPADGDLPVFLDYEVSGLGAGFRDAFCRQYQHRVGVAPGLYTGESMWSSDLGRVRGAARWLWLAHYGVQAPTYTCDIWQWQGDPDLDTAYTDLRSMTVGSNRGSSSIWHPIYNVDNTVWIQGRAPVLALEKRPYPSATQPTTVDMRKVPADRCANDRTGITHDWADYVHDLFAAIPWDSRPGATWAAHFGIVRNGSYGSTHFYALLEWGHLHGGLRPGGDSGDWALLWGSLQGQYHT
nr:GH25 family lysozyme [Fodinicola feengrottensis]